VRTFDGKPWRGLVDVVSGGFPCQDISAAGKGAGLEGERSGLWSEMSRIIGEVRPRFALVENSPVLTSRGLGVVLGDLASMGYDARWGVLGAIAAGAPHKRERIWIVANATGDRWGQGIKDSARRGKGMGERSQQGSRHGGSDVADTNGVRELQPQGSEARSSGGIAGEWWATEPDVGRVAHGVAARVARLRAIGNGQVPAVVRLAWDLLKPMK
jgi:DNA (cytosine-5)-methyltransferase 1